MLFLVDHLVARQTHRGIQRLIAPRLALQARQQHAAEGVQALQIGVAVVSQLRQKIVGADVRGHIAPKPILHLLDLRLETLMRLFQWRLNRRLLALFVEETLGKFQHFFPQVDTCGVQLLAQLVHQISVRHV